MRRRFTDDAAAFDDCRATATLPRLSDATMRAAARRFI